MLPILGRLRLMLFVTIFTLLSTSVLLFLDISHTVYLFPFNWPLIVSFFLLPLLSNILTSGFLILSLIEQKMALLTQALQCKLQFFSTGDIFTHSAESVSCVVLLINPICYIFLFCLH